MTVRKRLLRAIAIPAAFLLVPLAVGAPPASASTASDVSIYTLCTNSSVKPQGMWFSASNGQSGWANWGAGDAQGGQWFNFHLNSTITNVNLSIGCGGTPQNWAKVMSGAVAVFKVPSQRFIADCSGAGYTCRLINN